jgi:hypothetical protein
LTYIDLYVYKTCGVWMNGAVLRVRL